VKRFRYAHGKFDQGVTMTVAELREKLNDFPQDMPVLATWESVITFFTHDNFKVERYGDHHEDACDCLVIDVDQY
jgi:hypothetical protein